MKKVTKEFELYEVSELSPEAFRKAYERWNEGNDMPFLGSMLNDECNQLIHEEGITCTSNHPVVVYSLSHSQGDGCMFEGSFTWKNYQVDIKQSGHYTHSNSKSINIIENNDDGWNAPDSVYAEFEAIYQSICKKLEKFGYEWIEDETSDAHFIDECDANEWLFTKEGVIFND